MKYFHLYYRKSPFDTMENKTKKIREWSRNIRFPLELLFLPIKISLRILFGRNRKKNDIDILHVKKRFFESSQTVIGYATLLFFEIIFPYTICWGLGKWNPIYDLYIQPETYYSISLAVVALIVTIMLTLKISTREIESGEEFLNNLFEHCSSLELSLKKNGINSSNDKRRILNIITPNINLGAGVDNSNELSKIIDQNSNILFRFICMPISKDYLSKYDSNNDSAAIKHDFFLQAANAGNESSQLKYIYDRYLNKDGVSKLDLFIKEFTELIEKKNVVVCSSIINFDDDKTVGYSSYIECTLGKYYDVDKKVLIRGELVNTSEFIEHVDKFIIGVIAPENRDQCVSCKINKICNNN